MKTLRLLRNIAVLFILVMALLASRASGAQKTAKSCGYKPGFSCITYAGGNCQESQCDRSKGNPVCFNSGCVPHT